MWFLLLLGLLIPELLQAGTIVRPAKSNLQSSFTNGMTPTAADLNGDPDTIYSEFNGNISNVNISASAAIAATKISADGLTTQVRNVHTQPCHVLEESDQSADAKRWAMCVVGGELRISSHADAGTAQNDWIKVARASGAVTLGGALTVTGATTFNGTVTFNANTSMLPTGMVVSYVSTTPPGGWLNADGGSYTCTGSSGVNGPLCALLIAGNSGFKGSPGATITVDTTSNEIVHTAHGKSVNDRVHFGSTSTMPAPLNTTALYCIISTSTDRYKISTVCGGGEIDITSAGAGTRSAYYNFLTPDLRSRNIIGTGPGVGFTNRAMYTLGGEETHQLSVAEMPSHNHTYTAPGSIVNNSAGGGQPIIQSNSPGNSTGSTGGDGFHNVMDPFYVLNFIIKL